MGAAVALGAQAGCFPEYRFEEPEGGTGTGGTTSSSSTGPDPEDCTNGVDDDANGQIDCADPSCTDHTCVPEIPAGWEGYFALYDGAPSGDPGCPAQFPSTTTPAYLGNDGIMPSPAECECTCTAPQGMTCAPLDSLNIQTGDGPCGQATYCNGQLSVPAGWTGACTGNTHYPGGQLTCGTGASMACDTNTGNPCNVSVRSNAVVATGGSCQPNPVKVTRPDPTWERFGRACGDAPTTGLGCNIGQTCLPQMQAPYENGVCVAQQGDVPCPPGAFTEKHVFYGEVLDTRACTDDCSCGAAAGGTCPTTISIYADNTVDTCLTLVTSFPAGTCKDVPNNPTFSARMATAPGAPTGGSCQVSGGTPVGTVAPMSPKTFCCIP